MRKLRIKDGYILLSIGIYYFILNILSFRLGFYALYGLTLNLFILFMALSLAFGVIYLIYGK